MSSTSERLRKKKALKATRRINQQAKVSPVQWWRLDLEEKHRFEGTWLKRSYAYVKARTAHEAVILLHRMGAKGALASAKSLGMAESRWRLNVPLSAAWAVWVEA